MADLATGVLHVVATPIGNLADLSFRALEVLNQVDCIACEDTRHSRKLCRHYGISTPLISYYREKEQQKAEELVAMLLAGKHIALISDAGTPAISDPGAILVRRAREAGVEVRAIPGACALSCAVSLAGLGATHFYFGGFLPASSHSRRQALRNLSSFPCALIFYEAPHRISACLGDMLAVLGDRQAQLFRELTKIHEERLSGSLTFLQQQAASGLKGELVLIVDGSQQQLIDKPDNLHELLLWHRDARQSSLKEAVAGIAADLGLPRKDVYRQALEIWSTTQYTQDTP